MAMSEKHRHALYEYFLPGLGEEVTEAMLSHYPARDVEEPVTKEFLRNETTLIRMELRDEMSGLREELRTEMSGLRGQFASELHQEIAGVNDRMDTLAASIDARMSRQFFWLMTTILTTLGIMVASLVTILVALP